MNINIAITNNPTPRTLELLRQGEIDFADFAENAISSGAVHEIVVSDPLPPRQIYVAQGLICIPKRQMNF